MDRLRRTGDGRGAGLHTLEYRSTDVAGNVEDPRALPLKIDATAPRTTALVNGAAPVAAYAGGARVTFSRTDGDGSGAVATEYRVAAGRGLRTATRST